MPALRLVRRDDPLHGSSLGEVAPSAAPGAAFVFKRIHAGMLVGPTGTLVGVAGRALLMYGTTDIGLRIAPRRTLSQWTGFAFSCTGTGCARASWASAV